MCTGILSLLESKPDGILPTLDDQCLVASSSDASFLAVMAKKHADTPDFAIPKLSHTSFVIRHSAGTVEYEVDSFLDKNKDQLYPDLVELLASSSLSLVKALFTAGREPGKGRAAAGKAGAAGKASQHISVSAKFREQLGQLMKTLDKTRPTFVRCIKPNADKVPARFRAALVDHQLRCSGVYAAVKISQAGYPSRMLLREFAARYRFLLVGSRSATSAEEERGLCQRVLATLDVSSALYQLGRSKVFFKGGVVARLEELLSHVLVDSAALLQAGVRRRRTRSLGVARAASRAMQARARCALARHGHAAAVCRARATVQVQKYVRAALVSPLLVQQRRAATTLQTVVRCRLALARVREARARRAAAASAILTDVDAPIAVPPAPAARESPSETLPGRAAGVGTVEVAASAQDVRGLHHGASDGVATVAPAGRGVGSLAPDRGSGAARVGEWIQLSDGRVMTWREVETLLAERDKLLAVVSATEAGLSSSLVARSTSLQALMAAAPGPDEVAGQAVMTAIRQNLVQLEDTFDLARIGLRQSHELKKAVEALRESEKAVERLTIERKSFEGIRELVRMQEAELKEKTQAWDAEREVLEKHLLDSNIRRVKVEEEVDNFRHWHEAELPELQAKADRLKELDAEYEDVLHELTGAKIRLAEMDEANCVLAQELRKLRVQLGASAGGGTRATPSELKAPGHRW